MQRASRMVKISLSASQRSWRSACDCVAADLERAQNGWLPGLLDISEALS
jgi:hypothetical protein